MRSFAQPSTFEQKVLSYFYHKYPAASLREAYPYYPQLSSHTISRDHNLIWSNGEWNETLQADIKTFKAGWDARDAVELEKTEIAKEENRNKFVNVDKVTINRKINVFQAIKKGYIWAHEVGIEYKVGHWKNVAIPMVTRDCKLEYIPCPPWLGSLIKHYMALGNDKVPLKQRTNDV